MAAPTSAPSPTPSPTPTPAEPTRLPTDPADVILSATARTIATLEQAGRLDHPLGQVAVILAQRLDASYRDTGSAVASLARQHAAQLALATAGAGREASAVEKARDELARRRAQRSA